LPFHHIFTNNSQKHEKMIANDSVFLLFLLAVTLPSQPSEAIRGALFRSGRSPAFAPISGGHFVNLGSDEEERLLSLAPHPALMVDLRQLMAFSRATESVIPHPFLMCFYAIHFQQPPQAIIRPIPRENTVAEAIVPTKRAQKLLSPPPTITLGQQWKSPRLTAFLAMARKYGNPPQMQVAEEWMN
jgi:hypothetical protein